MMKHLLASSILLLMVLLAVSPPEAQAQGLRLEAAPFVGYGLNVPNQVGDKGSLSIGAQGHLYIHRRRISLILNPDFEYYLTDIESVNGLQADLNLLLGLGTPRTAVMPYLGAGVALTSVSGDDAFSGVQSGTNFGINLIGGLRFGNGPIHPFFQGRYTLFDHNLYFDDEVVASTGPGLGVQGGILFLLSQ